MKTDHTAQQQTDEEICKQIARIYDEVEGIYGKLYTPEVLGSNWKLSPSQRKCGSRFSLKCKNVLKLRETLKAQINTKTVIH